MTPLERDRLIILAKRCSALSAHAPLIDYVDGLVRDALQDAAGAPSRARVGVQQDHPLARFPGSRGADGTHGQGVRRIRTVGFGSSNPSGESGDGSHPTVWVILRDMSPDYHDDHGPELVGIFATEELAKEELRVTFAPDKSWAEEWEVDTGTDPIESVVLNPSSERAEGLGSVNPSRGSHPPTSRADDRPQGGIPEEEGVPPVGGEESQMGPIEDSPYAGPEDLCRCTGYDFDCTHGEPERRESDNLQVRLDRIEEKLDRALSNQGAWWAKWCGEAIPFSKGLDYGGYAERLREEKSDGSD